MFGGLGKAIGKGLNKIGDWGEKWYEADEAFHNWPVDRVLGSDRLRLGAAGAATYFLGPQAGQAVWNMPRDANDYGAAGDAWFGERNEAAGGLSPEERGAQLGRTQRAFLTSAYPGTNPWEHLGAGQGGSSGSVALSGQRTQDRMNRRTVAAQKYAVDKQTFASVAPSVLAHHPELAADILKTADPKFSSVGPSLNTSLKEREFILDDRIRTMEAEIKKADVDVKAFGAQTNRMMMELESDRLNFDMAVKEFETQFKDRQLAFEYVNMMRNLYDSMSSNAWRKFREIVDDIDEKRGLDNFYSQLKRAASSVETNRLKTPKSHRSNLTAPHPFRGGP